MKKWSPIAFAGPDDTHVNADMSLGQRGSWPDGVGYQQMIDELCAVVSKSSMTLDGAVSTQLAQAIRSQSLNYRAAGGTANALTVTLDPAPASNAAMVGMPLRVKITSTNTGAATINVNGVGPLPIQTSKGLAIAGGDLPAGAIVTVICTGTAWMLSGVAYSEAPQILPNGAVFYVRTDGNDNNNGLTNTPAGAYATIAAAVSGLSRYYSPNGSVTIQMGIAGTYASPGLLDQGTSILLRGDPASPSTYIVAGAGVAGGAALGSGGRLSLVGMTVRNTGSVASTLTAFEGGAVTLQSTVLASTAANTYAHLAASGGGSITINAGCSCSGNMGYLLFANGGAITLNGVSFSIPAATTFGNATAYAATGGAIQAASGSSIAAATVFATRYNANLNGVINTFGAGANFFPGNVAGVTSLGGQYA